MTRQYNSIFYNTVECDKIIQKIQRRRRCVQQIATIMFNATFFSSLLFSSLRGRQPLSCLALRLPIGPNALPLINQLVIEISWWFLQTSRE